MIRILSIFLSIYIFIGASLLPNGDFGLISQTGRLYDAFIQVNGQVSFDEFFAEEFLDPYSIPDDENDTSDEPFEKEHHAVPIDFNINPVSSPYIIALSIEIEPIQTGSSQHTIYKENYTSIDQNSVFHPPRLSQVTV